MNLGTIVGSQSTAQRVRNPTAAGRFYPRDPEELRKLVSNLLDGVSISPGPSPKALIVPHAGYPYSGPVAASAYAHLRAGRGLIKRIVLLGPSHFVSFFGLAATKAEAFATPLGAVPVDREALERLSNLPQFQWMDDAHAHEHSLEVQLPFLQVALGDFVVVPLVAGEADVKPISQVLQALWGGPETCLVISSDLSHYLEPGAAQQLDRATANAIESLEPGAIGEDQACGRVPIRGLLHAAAQRGLRARTVDLRNSGDTGGPRGQVVGYGAFVFQS